MAIEASDRTLGLINIWQVLRKLLWEVELLKAIPTKLVVGIKPIDVLHVQDAGLYAAINAASTSLALVDWLYHTIREDHQLMSNARATLRNIQLSSEKAFLLSMRELYKPINACHQICNSNKHFHLHKPDRNFKVMVAEIIMEHPDGSTNISTVPHIMQNGEGTDGSMLISDMLVNLGVWWEDVLVKIGVPGRDQFLTRSEL
ncbi:hypothetical protein [Dyella nitratireducens]|uniref:Uncharacterized protein n=1 Tax=Dyella nitratireducens TaxID=1849580 RepID=A0ABQ1G9I0_9GAMM|nr:hypothetical protein [Dyella nitratireducens]GGA39369.1 hypothetical protein GCM10010981_30770 [Dyella nitratireducens]GLQ40434.1 hypothetical protein GCM10007902_02830 [Dyella nitratireducens]